VKFTSSSALSLPYRLEVSPVPSAEGGGYTTCIPLLGRWAAAGDGETAAEAIADLQAPLPSLVQEWLNNGTVIPEPPGASETLSGTLSPRLPRTLHAAIAQAAAEKASASTGSSSPPQKVPGIGEQADSLRDF